MNCFSKFLIAILVLTGRPCYGAANEVLNLSLKTIEYEEGENRGIRVKLVLSNGNLKECLKFSRFTVETVVEQAWFRDEQGNLWSIPIPPGLRHPLPAKRDYEFKVTKSEPTTLWLSFQGMAPAGGKSLPFPKSLKYICFGQVSVVPCDNGKPFWIVAGGKGEVEVIKRGTR